MQRTLNEYENRLIQQLLKDSNPETLAQLSDQDMFDAFDAFARLPEEFEIVILLARLNGEAERRISLRHGDAGPKVEAKACAERLAFDLLADVLDRGALAKLSVEEIQDRFDRIALLPEGATQNSLYVELSAEASRRVAGRKGQS